MIRKTEIQESPENENRLLSSEERVVLSQIAVKEPPDSLRAQALLAIDEGATQAEAGQQTGLTIGQIRYWLSKFRKDRASIFPEELLNQAQQVDADTPQSSAEPIASADKPVPEPAAGEEEVQQEMPDDEEAAGSVDEVAEQQVDAPQAKKKPKKKSKKAKKSKKVKKTKQVKKKKKGKKPTKKTKKKGSKKAKDKKGKSSKKT